MSVAYYIAAEKEMAGFDHFVDGKALAHADAELIGTICKTLGVVSLFDFVSQDPDELADFLEDAGAEEVPAFEGQWFSAGAGLKTTKALRAYLRSNLDAIEQADGILEDLDQYCSVLERLADAGVGWHLSVDY